VWPASPALGAPGSYIGPLTTLSTLGSTVPANGDLNPYGIVTVPRTTGALRAGDVLVSNFNNNANVQGTGTTIVQVSPGGSVTQFAQVPEMTGGTGLTTALALTPSGFVIVGSLPTIGNMLTGDSAGALVVLDSSGTVVDTLSGGDINGPWDMTSVSEGPITTLFVTNVLNGTAAAGGATVDRGTVLRLVLRLVPGVPPVVLSENVIASGFGEHADPNALVVGPTGVGLGHNDTLYVGDTAGNRIAAIPNAMSRTTDDGTGLTVTSGGFLNGPLGLTIAPRRGHTDRQRR
jgi:hypothetical protein